MPRINRKRRGLGDHERITPGSVRWQSLMWAQLIIPSSGPSFASEPEAIAAWRELRADLMHQCSPGERPAAYFKFELGLNPPPNRLLEQVAVLLDRNLIDAIEATEIESHYPMLNADQATAFCSEFDSAVSVLYAHHHGAEILSRTVARFDLASRWHAWRGRPELAELYARRHAIVLNVLEQHNLNSETEKHSK